MRDLYTLIKNVYTETSVKEGEVKPDTRSHLRYDKTVSKDNG